VSNPVWSVADLIRGLKSGADGVLGDRLTHTIVSPIGIDTDKFAKELAKPTVRDLSDSLRQTYQDKRVILGIDRLDYIKGLPRKIEAIDQLLNKHPHWIGKVTLIQVIVPSREDIAEYQALLSTLYKLADETNSKFGK
jgi:trehalose-6-phosphate synthase